MPDHAIFYYPYASFTEAQAPLLKAAALYFDRLYVLDPTMASWDRIGPGELASDLNLLEDPSVGILERVSPATVLAKYERLIVDAIDADLHDEEFLRLCAERAEGRSWTLALAKIPESRRDHPDYQPLDASMQRLMGEEAQRLRTGAAGYLEAFRQYAEVGVDDEYREVEGDVVEYRYGQYPLALGEAIMLNHALFASLVHTGATPLTDDPFHNRVLDLKIERARKIPEVRDLLEKRAVQRGLTRGQLAATALQDLDLAIIPPGMAIEQILEYRRRHSDELERARDRLGWMAREIREVPWSQAFADELERTTIPAIHKELEPVKKSWSSWLKAAGLATGGTAAVISLAIFPVPLLSLGAMVGLLGLVQSVAIPGVELALDWRAGRQAAAGNGLHYLLKLKDGPPGGA